tara:strand:- start:704 stop:979 length:276 start_codon:yes stop_codon:yes gene_type:complete
MIHKRNLAFLIASLYLLSLFKPLGAIIHYTANYGFYSNVLCENKDKPELHCNGTCAFAKKHKLSSEPKELPNLPVFESLNRYIAIVEKQKN